MKDEVELEHSSNAKYMLKSTIGKKAVSSIVWSSFEHMGVQGLALLITIIISRLISPSDYGLIAMLSIFMSLSQDIINSGFSSYLIQNKKCDQLDFSTVFYLNVFLGIVCYLTLYLIAPYIAEFYNQKILTDVVKIYGISLILSSLTLTQKAKLFTSYKFKKTSIITVVSLVIAGSCAIFLAYMNWGVWTLVAYHIIQTGTVTILLWLLSGWHPSLTFSFSKAKSAFNFGSNLLGANLLSSAVSNIYTMVIGKRFQAVDLGFYSRGQSLASVYPVNLSNIFQQASYPVLCDLQNDTEALKRVFCNYIRLSACISFPVMILIACLAKPLVIILLTDKWLNSVIFIQILAIGYMFNPIMRLNFLLLSVTGKSKYTFWSESIKKSLLVIILFLSLPFGISWVAIGFALYSIIDIAVVSIFVKKIIPLSFFGEIRLFVPFIIYSLFIGLITIIIINIVTDYFFQIIISTLISLGVYIALLRIFSPSFTNMATKQMNSFIKK